MGKLFLLFTLVPVAELYVLLQIGDRFGGLTAVTMVIGSGLFGAYMARSEGLRVFQAWRDSLANGTVPADGVVSGMLVLLGCALMITPGVITDVAGIVLLVPYTRRLVAGQVMRRVERAIERGTLQVMQGQGRRPASPRRSVIDVEGEVVEPERAESERRLKP